MGDAIHRMHRPSHTSPIACIAEIVSAEQSEISRLRSQ